MFYGFDIADIIDKQLPTRKKGAIHLDWIFVLINSLKSAYDSFITYKADSLKELSYNSQTIIFEKLLNDFLDDTLRRIYIDNSFDNKEPTHLFNKGEDVPVYLYDIAEAKPPVYLYDKIEFLEDYDFTIYVPTALTGEEDRLRAIANKYKLASTEYNIIYY